MNAPTNADAAPAAAAPARGRGRGRAGYAQRGVSRQARAAPKAPTAKIGPNRLLETEWVKDSILKGNVFVLFAGSGQSGDQQWTYHHPIGETPLDPRAWVCTPTRDISFLLQRRESEELSSWKRKADLAKRQDILRQALGRRIGPDNETEVWNFENAPAIQPTIRSCMSAAKAANANESEWLRYADRAVQVAEQQFKESLRTHEVPQAWLRANPKPRHETMGGPLGDHPQKAVPFLNGLSLASAKDKVIRVAIGMDSSDEIAFPEGDDGLFDDDEEQSSSGPNTTVANATAGSSGTSPKGKAAVPTVQVPGSRKVSPTK
jgi:hypothetical protein